MVQYMEEADPAPVAIAPAETSRTPWHVWFVGVISLLWNLIGATDYTMSQTRNQTWMEAGAQQMGVSAQDMIAYLDGFPAWMHAFWALGVWGAVAGSVLLLMRSRHAVVAFAVSLLGLAVTQFYRAFTPQPEWVQGDLAFNLVLWSIAAFLLIYAVSMKTKGVIR
ncbi:MAG: hypothetical protein EOP04_09815 [Proteobacteria bacterium]|nr:MAG: hypothetical protein EOP04_09815 [Pseudomonadota bacterium]